MMTNTREFKFVNSSEKRIVVVDDEQGPRDILADILEFRGFQVSRFSNGADAIRMLEEDEVDCILCDVRMPGMNGIAVLKAVLATQPHTPVIMISGIGTIEDAVYATKLGAFDFLEKPLEAEKLLVTVRNALKQRELQLEKALSSSQTLDRYGIVGESPSMKTLYAQIERIAPTNCRIVIRGETGTGKELVARAIHKLSERAHKPLIAVNCAAVHSELIESTLFGHKKGAFTGANENRTGKFIEAHEGTLFLDEVLDLSSAAQAKVLRAVELGEVEPLGGRVDNADVRLIVATQKPLRQAVEEGLFREDLFHRLHVVELVVPPLRERKDDVKLLAQHFFKSALKTHNRTDLSFLPSQALTLLAHQNFTGNVRELQHVVERLVLFANGPEITGADIYAALESGVGNWSDARQGDFPYVEQSFQQAKDNFERAFLRKMLAQHEHSISTTAEALKMDRTTLWRKIKKFGLEGE